MLTLLILMTCVAVGLFAHNCALADQNADLRDKLTRTRAALVRARAGKDGHRSPRFRVLDSGFDRPRAPRGGA